MNHAHYPVYLNARGSMNLSTRLPPDFYQAQAKDFQSSITGIQSHVDWKSGPLVNGGKQVNIERVLVFPQGTSAIFSALINHDGNIRIHNS